MPLCFSFFFILLGFFPDPPCSLPSECYKTSHGRHIQFYSSTSVGTGINITTYSFAVIDATNVVRNVLLYLYEGGCYCF